MVMAMDRRRLIGRAGGLPWHIPEDLKHFKVITTGKAIIMGRRTFSDDIKRALPQRTNIVVTRDPEWRHEGVEVVHGLAQAYALADRLLPAAEEHCVIGGAQLCREAMAQTERLYLTLVQGEFQGDTWLDSFDFGDWVVADERHLAADAKRDVAVVFYTLDRPAGAPAGEDAANGGGR